MTTSAPWRRTFLVPLVLTLLLLTLSFAVVVFLSRPPAGTQGGHEVGRDAGAARPRSETLGATTPRSTHSVALPSRCEGTVLLFRHCEKGGTDHLDDEGNEHCDYVGYERAAFLATLFGDEPSDRWPSPAYLFAMSKDRPGTSKLNYRQTETLTPLASKLDWKIPIVGTYGIGDEKHLAEAILARWTRGDLCGKVAVVSWRHGDIGKLAKSLGCGPQDGCPMQYDAHVYDDVWEIKLVVRRNLHGGDWPPFGESSSSEDDNSTMAADGEVGVVSDGVGSSETVGGMTAMDRGAQSLIRDNVGGGRSLKHRSSPPWPTWNVYGTVVQMGFDPLRFSKMAGDYPRGGAANGGRWRANDEK